MNRRSPALAAAAETALIRLYAEPPAAEAQTEPHVFSPGFEKAMARLTRHVRGGRYHPLTRAAKAALIAAVLAALLAGSAMAAEKYGFSITRFWDHAEVDIEKHHEELQEGLTVGYVPEGFVLSEEYKDSTTHKLIYQSVSDPAVFFGLQKLSSYSGFCFDTENRDVYEVERSKIKYTISKSEQNTTILWMRSDTTVIYTAYGTVNSDILLEIAYQVQ